MPKMESPPFSRNIQQSAQRPLREFNVGIPTEEELDQMNVNPYANAPVQAPQPSAANIESQVQQARKEKSDIIKYGPRISEHAKRRIEILANIGRLTRDVKIGDATYSLRTLKNNEYREATLESIANAKNDFEASFEARRQQLARSLYKIDGEDINVVLGSDDPEAKLALLDNSEEVIIDKLWNELVSLKEEVKTKYGINTAKETEEVAADLKK